MILLNDLIVSVQVGLTGGMALSKFMGWFDYSWLVVTSPFWILWVLWLVGAVLYFPYWYFYRRNK